MDRRTANLWLLLALWLLVCCSGCSWTIRPPAQRPADAVAVYVADYGWHSSLLLPTGNKRGEFIEYVLGDWGYAAKGHTSPFDAMGALFASNQAALGRRTVEIDMLHPEIDNAGQRGKLVRIDVSRARVEALLKRMDERYAAGTDTLHNPGNGQTYVKIPDHYSWTNSCNTMTKVNAERLGCRVDGSPIFSNFKVVPVPGVSTGTWLPPVAESAEEEPVKTETAATTRPAGSSASSVTAGRAGEDGGPRVQASASPSGGK